MGLGQKCKQKGHQFQDKGTKKVDANKILLVTIFKSLVKYKYLGCKLMF